MTEIDALYNRAQELEVAVESLEYSDAWAFIFAASRQQRLCNSPPPPAVARTFLRHSPVRSRSDDGVDENLWARRCGQNGTIGTIGTRYSSRYSERIGICQLCVSD
jgi:hypothetical protein